MCRTYILLVERRRPVTWLSRRDLHRPARLVVGFQRLLHGPRQAHELVPNPPAAREHHFGAGERHVPIVPGQWLSGGARLLSFPDHAVSILSALLLGAHHLFFAKRDAVHAALGVELQKEPG